MESKREILNDLNKAQVIEVYKYLRRTYPEAGPGVDYARFSKDELIDRILGLYEDHIDAAIAAMKEEAPKVNTAPKPAPKPTTADQGQAEDMLITALRTLLAKGATNEDDVRRIIAEEGSPAWWRGDTFPRLRDALAVMELRPGAVTPGSRPPDPSNDAPVRMGTMITNLYNRKAHLYGSRCQVLQGRGMVNDTDMDTLDVRSSIQFRELAGRKPMQCCGWCLKLAGA